MHFGIAQALLLGLQVGSLIIVGRSAPRDVLRDSVLGTAVFQAILIAGGWYAV